MTGKPQPTRVERNRQIEHTILIQKSDSILRLPSFYLNQVYIFMEVIEYGPVTDKKSFVEILSRLGLMEDDLYFIVVRQNSPFSYHPGAEFYHSKYAIGKPFAYKFVCALKDNTLYHDGFSSYLLGEPHDTTRKLYCFVLIGKAIKIATRLHKDRREVETEDD